MLILYIVGHLIEKWLNIFYIDFKNMLLAIKTNGKLMKLKAGKNIEMAARIIVLLFERTLEKNWNFYVNSCQQLSEVPVSHILTNTN